MHNGEPHVILRPAVEEIGLTYPAQYRKLKGRSWGSVAQKAMQVPGDTQRREWDVVPVRTFLMLLATIDEKRVKLEARPVLIAYQSEAADALEAYWLKGGAVNPAATPVQVLFGWRSP